MKDKKEKSESTASQIGSILKSICYFITILFCTLRACDVITWSWFWIMSPMDEYSFLSDCLNDYRSKNGGSIND